MAFIYFHFSRLAQAGGNTNCGGAYITVVFKNYGNVLTRCLQIQISNIAAADSQIECS